MTQPLNVPPYVKSAIRAQEVLTLALKQAENGLPQRIRMQQWVVAKKTSQSWQAVEAWYREEDPRNPQVWQTLRNIVVLAKALAELQTFSVPDVTINVPKLWSIGNHAESE